MAVTLTAEVTYRYGRYHHLLDGLCSQQTLLHHLFLRNTFGHKDLDTLLRRTKGTERTFLPKRQDRYPYHGHVPEGAMEMVKLFLVVAREMFTCSTCTVMPSQPKSSLAGVGHLHHQMLQQLCHSHTGGYGGGLSHCGKIMILSTYPAPHTPTMAITHQKLAVDGQ